MTVDTKTWPELRYKIAGDAGPLDESRRLCSATSVACLCFASLLLVASVTGTYLLWFTGFFEDLVHSSTVYANGSDFFRAWLAPPFGPTTKLYLFNYTNAAEFMAGNASRLRVQELGPYAYSETLEHVNVHFHSNGTMSYSEKRAFTFLPEWSRGSEDDVIVVPNLPLICAIARVRDEPYVAQLGLRSALWASGGTAFHKLVVRDYLFGYDDPLYNMAKKAVEVATTGTLPKLGMLAPRVGLSSNVYTVQTGQRDFRQQDRVTRLNGRAALAAWRDPECNSIDGSAGTFFPADVARRRGPLHLVNADVCRRIPLEFKEEVTVMDGIPALRYGPPDHFLDNAQDNPNNTCYSTPSYASLPSGVLLNGPCFMDSPSFISFPRFYLGDARLRTALDGMEEPVKEQHEMFFDVHPELGINLGAATRLQVNVMVRKAAMLDSYLEPFQDEIILPILWFETALTEFPDDVKRATFHATFTVRTLERAASYGLPLVALACVVFLALHALRHRQQLLQRRRQRVQVVRVS
ncbi:lysosome membrane protein 2-like [Thrips palmi]|uniref:Lysosome membrane protein 2-like n=1 Tax=Thrips palmi TaxID=161013 RepID=A0A6P8YM81_THRPL|nr:lysosome membrane protein 2-like [Thrips palmi]XP_034235124.1 lysosome membrane protein 2-like [Thrips palmi]XP_034235125.1 lysosome membrane protein 2-like [Thrips palmi]XP_034235127.1 lysosome membrane protein 2-like [Thrips palmi]